jgi:hypothetical protein
MILLLTWIADHAVHLTPSSVVNLLLLFATISFVLDFLRERENMRHPRPGWDAMPPRGWFGAVGRRVRQMMKAGTGGAERVDRASREDRVPATATRQTRAA